MSKEERKSFLRMQGMLLMQAEMIVTQDKRIAALEAIVHANNEPYESIFDKFMGPSQPLLTGEKGPHKISSHRDFLGVSVVYAR